MDGDGKIGGYDSKVTEEMVLNYWANHKIYSKSVEKNKKGKKYHYLDGPPYTTGARHIGHAWGKALRDASLRFRRMQGFNCWDTPGFDTHGLPIEVQVEKKFEIKNKQEILEKFGLKKFIEECKNFAVEQMHPMITDFKRIGVWLDWDSPYITFKNEYIEGAWWALKRAQEKGLLYQGEKAMTWCPRCATTLAKHELEYESLKEDSVFIKFKVKGKENEYLVIWTTTPWTIPFNLAVMANPELDYVKAKVDNEVWILAKGMAPSVIGAVAGKKFEVVEEFKGSKLEGLEYEHPLEDELKIYDELEKKHTNVCTVLLSKEYVSLGSGSGLVHCAPGCGPEDYEVGRKYKIPPFNELDEHGRFGKSMGRFSGMTAKVDDKKFIEIFREKGILIDTAPVEHDYAHCWRCKTAVVYKTTDQWFLAVEKLKEKMIEENKKVVWVPDWAGSRWFRSWLTDLQDWCISRQRFWGIPLPIWKCTKCKEIKIIESKEDLEKLSGKKIDDLHRPWVDELEIKCKCKSKMKRIEDVLDVWLDSGAATWATTKKSSKWGTVTADFILEGKAQIRGWFNSLTCLSTVSREINAYKAVYMHGFVNDSLGRKMSKSLKNIISPYEVIEKYGADTMRYYMIGAAKPGLDMNYNFDDMKVKFRNLGVLWNIHKFVSDYAETLGKPSTKLTKSAMGTEEKFIFSKLNSTIEEVTELYETYRLNEIPDKIESLYLDLSRTYIQMIREKSVTGTEKEKQVIFTAIYNVLFETLKMLATIAPFVTEHMYLNLKKQFGLKPLSIHLNEWPSFEEKLIDKQLEWDMEQAKDMLQAIYSARESSKLGIRWPVKDVTIVSKDENVRKAAENLSDIIKTQANVKKVIVKEDMGFRKKVKADFKKVGPSFGEKAPKIIAQLAINSPETILGAIEKNGKFIVKVDK
ncbi:isoleucine--tRNA ligase, partial [Candidatus Woesearchaeota archaeon]|nr:isoleucine--tRNA ligase [Candidatus Woesearchaeota archaeon]